MQQINQPTLSNKLGKWISRPLSRVILNNVLRTKIRIIEAYIAFIQGKGSGTGWDMLAEIKAANSFIYRNQPTILDIGANVGTWSKLILQFNPTANIYLFEPSIACQEHIHGLKLKNASLIPYAIGKEKSTGLLYSPSPNSPIASLYKRRDTFITNELKEYKINITTIDDFISEYSIEFIDFMKMDIEGNELDALMGADQALSNKCIGALSFEFGSGNINSRTFFRDFWDLLVSNSYKIYRITPGGHLLEINEYYEDLEYFRGVTNYVAVLKDHPYA